MSILKIWVRHVCSRDQERVNPSKIRSIINLHIYIYISFLSLSLCLSFKRIGVKKKTCLHSLPLHICNPGRRQNFATKLCTMYGQAKATIYLSIYPSIFLYFNILIFALYKDVHHLAKSLSSILSSTFSIDLSIYLPAYLCSYLYIRIPTFLYSYLYIHIPTYYLCTYTYLSICMFIY